MAEQFLMQMVGGPHPGARVIPETILPWPLPDRFEVADYPGVYVKVSESKLPPMPEDGHVIRGAEYRWEPADA
jgi:hypothetical protein